MTTVALIGAMSRATLAKIYVAPCAPRLDQVFVYIF